MDEQERIKQLEKLIPYLAEHYYAGDTLVSDEEFDKLTDELKSLCPESPILHKVGWGSEENSKGKIKVEHKYTTVGSLEKTREFDGIPKTFINNKRILVSPKLDGLSMACYYVDGEFDKAVTRGNGKIGIDKSDKLRIILSRKNISLPNDFTGCIRGEILIPKNSWEIIKRTNSDANNSRNFAAGLINRDDNSSDLQYLDFVTYKVLGDEKRRFKTKTEVVEFLKDCGFDTIWSKNIEITKDTWQNIAEELYNDVTYPYQLDGLVMSSDIISYNDKNGIEYDEFAYKFQSEQVWSKVTNIKWELSKNQRLVPTIQVEPIEILETIVSNITGNNAQWIKDREIAVGKEVLIEKANEIIPQIREVR